MFFKAPRELGRQRTASDIPEGPIVAAAREKAAANREAVVEAENQLRAIGDEVREAERRVADVGRSRTDAESLVARAATGEEVPSPSGPQLLSIIQQHARAEQDLAKVRARSADEGARLEQELVKLHEQASTAELDIDRARFQEALDAYRDAIRPAIPLARAVREAAARIHRVCDNEPLLIDPDADYGRQLFGAQV
jgi:chromosome segregation ATPase